MQCDFVIIDFVIIDFVRFTAVHKMIWFTHVALKAAWATNLRASNYCKKGTMDKRSSECKTGRDSPDHVGTVTELGVPPFQGNVAISMSFAT